MGSLDDTCVDIDELAKNIEKRIQELEAKEKESKKEKEYHNDNLGSSIESIDEIIHEIDRRIAELEKEEENIDVQDLTDKINQKLMAFDEVEEEDLGKTRYDLEEISRQINETIKNLEEKKKEKKRKKAMYCDMARKNKNKMNRAKKNNKASK